jgi:glycosyltransferase involved in cell wall biosynthesis
MKNGNKIKIVEIVRSAEYGGVETHVRDILEYGIKSGYEMSLVSLTNVTPNKSFQELGVEIILLPDMQWMSPRISDNIKRSIGNIINLYKILKIIKPDIVHLHGTRPIFIGSIAARCAKIDRIISTVHGSYKLMSYLHNGCIDNIKLLSAKIICFIGMLLSKRIIAVSNAVKEELLALTNIVFIRNHFKNKLCTIYSGLDAFNYKISNRYNRYRSDTSTTIIGTVTRLDEPMKGISVLLKATKILIDMQCDIKVLIAGDGVSKVPLTRLTNELNLTHVVDFLGYCDNTKELYKNFDIFVLPSLSEGLGIVNLEAMAASLPVVASDVGGIPEAVRHNQNGLLVPPNDEKQLALAIHSLIKNKEKAINMGIVGYKIVTKEFDKNNSLRTIFSEYITLLN